MPKDTTPVTSSKGGDRTADPLNTDQPALPPEPHLKRAILKGLCDSATNTTVRKSKGLSTNLKEHIIDLNKSGKSKLGAISKQLQVPRSTVQTSVSKY